MAYGRNPTTFKRQQVFMGSTNRSEYLSDNTGNRRFWPVHCEVTEIDLIGLRRNVEQIWAEAVYMYRVMRRDQPEGALPLYLQDPRAKAEAMARQESRRQHTEADHFHGMFQHYLDTPYRDGDDFDASPWRYKHRISPVELWSNVLGNKADNLIKGKSLEIASAVKAMGWTRGKGRRSFGTFGQQNYFERPVAEAERMNREISQRNVDEGLDMPDVEDDDPEAEALI
jgi:hypothetical protein